jgi:hypothetical protein
MHLQIYLYHGRIFNRGFLSTASPSFLASVFIEPCSWNGNSHLSGDLAMAAWLGDDTVLLLKQTVRR